MDKNLQSFRSATPKDGYPVVGIDYSPTGSRFLVVTAWKSPRVYDRDGNKQLEFQKGDMYIRDMNNTKVCLQNFHLYV